MARASGVHSRAHYSLLLTLRNMWRPRPPRVSDLRREGGKAHASPSNYPPFLAPPPPHTRPPIDQSRRQRRRGGHRSEPRVPAREGEGGYGGAEEPVELGDPGVRAAEVVRAGRTVAAGAVPCPPLFRLRRARHPARWPVAALRRGQGSEAQGSGQGRAFASRLCCFLITFGGFASVVHLGILLWSANYCWADKEFFFLVIWDDGLSNLRQQFFCFFFLFVMTVWVILVKSVECCVRGHDIWIGDYSFSSNLVADFAANCIRWRPLMLIKEHTLV